jgi:hypothetical protein
LPYELPLVLYILLTCPLYHHFSYVSSVIMYIYHHWSYRTYVPLLPYILITTWPVLSVTLCRWYPHWCPVLVSPVPHHLSKPVFCRLSIYLKYRSTIDMRSSVWQQAVRWGGWRGKGLEVAGTMMDGWHNHWWKKGPGLFHTAPRCIHNQILLYHFHGLATASTPTYLTGRIHYFTFLLTAWLSWRLRSTTSKIEQTSWWEGPDKQFS